MYVTERAVFRLAEDGIELLEVAPGIDLHRDVLERIGFPVRIAAPVTPMDPRLFRPEPMNLLPGFRRRSRAAREVRPTRRGEG
jgi:propionate CoA-transferase